MNATLDESPESVAKAALFYTQFRTEFLRNYQFVYMHQTLQLRILVPRLNELLSMIAVMVDPFDVETWTLYGAMILTAAVFRFCCARRFTLRQFIQSIQDVVACTILNRSIRLHRQLEQLVVACLKLVNVVLTAAYGSLVISFLLNPRFHPELDTLDQINESCCWWWTLEFNFLKFRHFEDCLSVILDKVYIPRVSDRGRFQCYLVDSTMETLSGDMLSDPAIATHYRWSKLAIQQYPVIAIAIGGVGMVKRISFYAEVFFAEGGLYKFFGEEAQRCWDGGSNQDTPIGLEDLSLLWTVYCFGIASSFAVFVAELAKCNSRIKCSK